LGSVSVISAGREGQVIAEKYRLITPVGRGGMGSVWRAEHVTLGAPVAVKLVEPKLLDPNTADVNEVLARFLREARAAAAIRSPHVVQILDHGIENGAPYMVLELLEGENLEQRLERERILPFAKTAQIITGVARALTRAHEAGIVHRDLKPSNVFLVRNDDDEIAKVLDFGLAKMPRALLANRGSELTRSGNVLGTPYYMGPEQAQGSSDYRTDLYATAVIVFECVCGQLPFNHPVLAQLLIQICVEPLPIPSKLATVPAGFDAWFAKAAHRDPERRFQSAKEMAEALRAVLTPERAAAAAAAPAPPPPPVAPLSHPSPQLASVSDQQTLVQLRRSGGDEPARSQPISTIPPFARPRSALWMLAAGAFALTALAGAIWMLRKPPPEATGVAMGVATAVVTSTTAATIEANPGGPTVTPLEALSALPSALPPPGVSAAPTVRPVKTLKTAAPPVKSSGGIFDHQ
jgi:eukaryotic-like serine/threonine-protein kinase